MSTGLIRKRFRIDRGFDQLPVTTIKLSLPGINRGQFEPDSKRLRPTGRADQYGPRSNRMEFLMSIKSKIAALSPRLPSPAAWLRPQEQKPRVSAGASEPAWLAPPSSAARSRPMTAITMTAIAAAAGFASSMLTATTWAAFAPAITDDRVNWNALAVASGTGASSTPCRTRPARLSPRAGHP